MSSISVPADARAARRIRVARVVTEAFAPAVLVVGVLPAVGWHSTRSLAGVGWGLLGALFCGGIPIAFIVYGVKRGYWTDRHVRIRQQRAIPIVCTAVSVVVGLAVLLWMGAPREVVALVVAMLAGLAVALAVTAFWKISVHTAVAGGTVAVLMLTYGPVVAVAAPLVALIGWSRVELRDHTPMQTFVGGLVGAVVAAMVFTLAQ